MLRELNHFLETCENDPSFIFMDSKLEDIRRELFKHIQFFTATIRKHSFDSVNSTEWKKVYPELERDNDKVETVAKSLNKNADEICKLYDIFIKTAAKNIGA